MMVLDTSQCYELSYRADYHLNKLYPQYKPGNILIGIFAYIVIFSTCKS